MREIAIGRRSSWAWPGWAWPRHYWWDVTRTPARPKSGLADAALGWSGLADAISVDIERTSAGKR